MYWLVQIAYSSQFSLKPGKSCGKLVEPQKLQTQLASEKLVASL